MGLQWTFGRKLAGGFAIAALLILLIGAAGYRNIQRLIENDALVDHTTHVRTAIAEFGSAVKDAETGQRGFVITGDDAFLLPYRQGEEALERHFRELRHLTSDNAAQQVRLESLRSAIDAKLLGMGRVIAERRKNGFEAAQKAIQEGLGKAQMERIRSLLIDLDKEELRLLAIRSQDAARSSEVARSVIVWGSLLGILFIAFSGSFIARSLGRQIGSAVQHIQASSTELQTAANQQAMGAKEQATAMTEISTTISELLATSRQIAESARRVTGIAEHTARSSLAGEQTVIQGRESIARIRDQVELIVTHMLDLSKKSQQIGNVLSIVAELAEQTNILAINATIEAAGAGEAGRRFGVVADEIRKLADRVGSSTKEIRSLIDDVRGAVNVSIMSTEAGSKAVEAGSNQFRLVATAFEQISSQVSTTTEAAKEIELSTKQQASAVEQVNVAITNVAQGTRESEVSAVQTLRTAAELAQLSDGLSRIIHSEIGPYAPQRNA